MGEQGGWALKGTTTLSDVTDVSAPPFHALTCRSLFEIVLFEDCSNQWSLSRPMLPLILISEQIYNDLKASACA